MTNKSNIESNNYVRESIWVFISCFLGFYFLALFSYSSNDPSFYNISSPIQSLTINKAGKLGAEVSAHLITWLGISSYTLPFVIGYSAFKNFRKKITWFLLSKFFLEVCLLTSLILLALSLLSGKTIISGWLGNDLSSFTQKNFGTTGSWLLLITTSYIYICLNARISLLNSLKNLVLRWLENTFLSFNKRIFQGDLATGFLNKIRGTSFLQRRQKTEVTTVTPDNAQRDIDLEEIETQVYAEDIGASGLEDLNNQQGFHMMLEQQLWEGNTPDKVNYTVPSSSHFKSSTSEGVASISEEEMNNIGQLLTKTLLDFGVTGKIIGYQPGPVVTVYEFQPDAGIKQSKITGLIDDIALSLKVDSILINPVKGKRALGIQVPNSNRQVVFFGDVVTSKRFHNSPSPLTFAMGKALDGKPEVTDLTGMPHLLVAGATGSGKSVGINSLICSVVMKASPAEVKMILVDPKMLELSVYEGIPHLLMPVITEASKAALALRWAVNEMERRYKIMQTVQVRNIQAFNAFWKKQTDEKKAQIREDLGDHEVDHLPFILLVIDELADLMLSAPKEVESIIQRLAQKARASGIHMVLATQRPSVDIITGVIKANLPSRIAFQVVSKHDSRTILDQMGADKLLGKGDMLFQRPGISKIDRIQGAFVSDEEVVSLVNQIKNDHSASYNEDLIDWINNEASKQDTSASTTGIEFEDDPKWDEAILIAQKNGQISASFLQRQLKIGYNRAARIVESMESQGLVDQSSGSKPRKWKGPQENSPT